MRTSLPDILERLDGVRKSGDEYTAKCPAHEDRNPSLSIAQGSDGKLLLHCFAGCEYAEIMAALSLEEKDGFTEDVTRTNGAADKKPDWNPFEDGKRMAEYDYTEADGAYLHTVVRFEVQQGHPAYPDKKFLQGIRQASGHIKWGRGDIEPVLYRLPAAIEAASKGRTVFIPEGEKDVHTVEELGLTATCNMQGAGEWKDRYSDELKGADVVILPDNHREGYDHARDIAESCHGKAKSVKIVNLPGVRYKGDITDWIEEGHTIEDLQVLVSETSVYEPAERSERAGDEKDEGNEKRSRRFPKWEPFPVDALPQAGAAYVRAASAALSVDPAMIALPMLSVLAAGVGTTRRVQLKRSWREKATIWTALVARSGTGKSAGYEKAIAPVNGIERKKGQENQVNMDDYKEDKRAYDLKSRKQKQASDGPPVEPVRERVRVSDTTIESVLVVHEENPRGLLLARDELAGWIGSFDRYANGESDMAAWIELYEGRYVQVDRKSAKKKVLDVERPSVSVCGTIQPRTLKRKLTQDHLDAGFAQRIMFAMPPEPETDNKWTEADVTAEVFSKYDKLVKQLYELCCDDEGAPRVVELTPGAKEVWIKWYNDGKVLLQTVTSGPLRSVYAKIEALAARLALVFQMCEKDDDISADAMKRGIYVAWWLRREATRVYATLGLEEAAQDPIYRFMDALPQTVKTKEARGMAKEFDVSERTIDNWLKQLTNAGLLVKQKRGVYCKHELDSDTEKKNTPVSSFVNFVKLHKPPSYVKIDEVNERRNRRIPTDSDGKQENISDTSSNTLSDKEVLTVEDFPADTPVIAPDGPGTAQYHEDGRVIVKLEAPPYDPRPYDPCDLKIATSF